MKIARKSHNRLSQSALSVSLGINNNDKAENAQKCDKGYWSRFT